MSSTDLALLSCYATTSVVYWWRLLLLLLLLLVLLLIMHIGNTTSTSCAVGSGCRHGYTSTSSRHCGSTTSYTVDPTDGRFHSIPFVGWCHHVIWYTKFIPRSTLTLSLPLALTLTSLTSWLELHRHSTTLASRYCTVLYCTVSIATAQVPPPRYTN